MEPQFAAVGIIGVFIAVVLVADRVRYRRAINPNDAWHCNRCGSELAPMRSESIAVAGGPLFATHAKVCARCARRDGTIRFFTWAVVVALFAVAIGLLWLQ
jgi:hypothetical protein